MNDFDELIKKISRELHIVKSDAENDENWKSRVVYSAIGEAGLLSLWDRNEDGAPVSIIHFKDKVRKLFIAYMELLPEIKSKFVDGVDLLADELYSLYLSEGYIYHTPNRILPCSLSKVNLDGIALGRGFFPSEKRAISGLGQYQKVIDSSADIEGVLSVFHIDKQPLLNFWEGLLKRANWQEIVVSSYVEFFNPSFSRGYWTNIATVNGDFSMLRMGLFGEKDKLYYLYKYDNGVLMGSQLPKWLVEGENYRKIANAILASYNVLPHIKVKQQGPLVFIKFNYLPALDVHNFIKLYSWPKSFYNMPCNFNRIMEADVWKAIKEILIYLGYIVEEYNVK